MRATSRRRALTENAMLVMGIASVAAILVPVLLGGRPNDIEVIFWAGSTDVLLIAARVYMRTTAMQRDTINSLSKQLRTMPDMRKCSACEFSADWFTVLMHEGAVHGL